MSSTSNSTKKTAILANLFENFLQMNLLEVDEKIRLKIMKRWEQFKIVFVDDEETTKETTKTPERSKPIVQKQKKLTKTPQKQVKTKKEKSAQKQAPFSPKHKTKKQTTCRAKIKQNENASPFSFQESQQRPYSPPLRKSPYMNRPYSPQRLNPLSPTKNQRKPKQKLSNKKRSSQKKTKRRQYNQRMHPFSPLRNQPHSPLLRPTVRPTSPLQMRANFMQQQMQQPYFNAPPPHMAYSPYERKTHYGRKSPFRQLKKPETETKQNHSPFKQSKKSDNKTLFHQTSEITQVTDQSFFTNEASVDTQQKSVTKNNLGEICKNSNTKVNEPLDEMQIIKKHFDYMKLIVGAKSLMSFMQQNEHLIYSPNKAEKENQHQLC